MSAAEAGHLVFGTLHTTGAVRTSDRLVDAFPTNQQDQIRTQLSTSIIGIISQQLLPKIGGGRVAAHEFLVCTPGIANLIRENKTFRITSSIQTGAKMGMKLLDDSIFHHWKNEKVSQEDAMSKANDPEELAKRIAKAKQGIFDDEDDVKRQAGSMGNKNPK